MDESDDAPELRSNPWPVHYVILAVLVGTYLVLAVNAWPTEAPPADGKLQEGLSVVTGIGQGAAAGSIVMGGVCIMFYAALSTALVGRFHSAWLVHGVAFGLGGLAILIGSA